MPQWGNITRNKKCPQAAPVAMAAQPVTEVEQSFEGLAEAFQLN
jgi:hypothetical protein